MSSEKDEEHLNDLLTEAEIEEMESVKQSSKQERRSGKDRNEKRKNESVQKKGLRK